jgi:hypothetical protein
VPLGGHAEARPEESQVLLMSPAGVIGPPGNSGNARISPPRRALFLRNRLVGSMSSGGGA